MTGTLATIGWLVGSGLLSMLLVRLAIGYAHRRGMLDQPGQRRSHEHPTPRGGGIGVVLTVALVLGLTATASAPISLRPPFAIAVIGALLLVAATGWWDDHQPLPVVPRLGAQLLAVLGVSITMVLHGLHGWWLPLLLGAGVWSINLHNFMDGIDGLLAQQAVFVGVGLAVLAWRGNLPAVAFAGAVLAAATAGFWFFNHPPARIFMGDVGSGAIGLLVFALSAQLWNRQSALLWPVLLLSSAFIVDATLTLLTRMWRGRRWLAAHREHLYQWLVRRDRSHAQVDMFYLGWNVLVAAPAAWLAASHSAWAAPVTIAVYVVAAAVWLGLKRRLLRRPALKASHGPA